MGLISYIQDIPASANNPSNDQPNMRLNTNAIANFLAVDHVPFDVNNSGYHTIIHQLPNGGVVPVDPITIAGVGQLYVKNVTYNAITDTQLFFKTGLGGISQLTGNNAVQNGWQILGGTILQWGQDAVLFNPTTTTINFPLTFPNACFSVVITPFRNASNVDTVYMVSQSPTSFVCRNTSGAGITMINWMAIGN